MGVASGCGEQEAGVTSGSGWNLWVWLLGEVVRRYIDFHTTYPYSSCLFFFTAASHSCSIKIKKLHSLYHRVGRLYM